MRMRFLGNDLSAMNGIDLGGCLLYTSDAADERSSVDLGGRRIIKKKKRQRRGGGRHEIIETKTRTGIYTVEQNK